MRVKGRGTSRQRLHQVCRRRRSQCDNLEIEGVWVGVGGLGLEWKKHQRLQMGWKVGSLLIGCPSSLQTISSEQKAPVFIV